MFDDALYTVAYVKISVVGALSVVVVASSRYRLLANNSLDSSDSGER